MRTHTHNHLIGHSSQPRIESGRAKTAAAVFEALEQRAMFTVSPDPGATFATAFNVGELNGSITLDDAVTSTDNTDYYKFNLPRSGQFFGRIRAYTGPAEVALIREVHNSDGSVSEIFVDARTADQSGPDAGFSSGDLPGKFLSAGTYYLVVSRLGGDTPYLIRFTADYAGGSIGTARDIGSASEDTYRDFVGQFGSPSLDDFSDFYKVKVDAPGQLWVDLALDNTDPNTFKAHFDLIRDANNNGSVDAGEVLGSSPSTTAGTVIQNVPAGTYFLRVVPDLNFSNYRLRVNADYAGSSIGTWRLTGSLDTGKTFTDFIHEPIDRMDQYRFSVTSPRVLNVVTSENGGTSTISLYKDTNNNGLSESTEIVASTGAASFNQLVQNIGPGTYNIQVRASTGGGKYTLYAEARPDQAGNTLATARNLGIVNGLTSVNDYVSVSDTVDLYRFTASAAGTVSAQLTPQFGNANLALIRDANNNGVVDAGEILASSSLTGTQPDRVSRSIAAGNYFLRVNYADPSGAARHFLTFHTDYAGSTTATARNVGALAGTRVFDDWASQEYLGGISDRVDLYKFSLTSTKSVTARTTGVLSGEDLALQIYRDANNNGILEANELVAATDKPNSPNEQLVRSLGAGTYFARVVGVNGDTNYRLSLTA
jgi:hypothetical protein